MQQFQALFLEGLQHDATRHVRDVDMPGSRCGALGEPATLGQHFFQVGFNAGKLVRHLGFDVQTRLVGATLGDVDDFVQGQNLQAVVAVARPVRIGLVEPRACVQLFEFRQREGADRVLDPRGEHLGDVGGAFQHVVVQRNQHAILGALDVHFQIVRTQIPRQGIGRDGFFRCVKRGTAMGDRGGPGQAVFFAQHLARRIRRRCHTG